MTALLSFMTEMVLQYPTFSIGPQIVTIIQSHNNPKILSKTRPNVLFPPQHVQIHNSIKLHMGQDVLVILG